MGFLNSDDYSSIKHVVRTIIDYVMGYLVSDDSYIALPDFTIILFKGKMIRINPKDAKRLEYSNNQGRSWQTLFTGGSSGEFKGLMDGGSELLAQTSKGLFYSKNDGKSWQKRA